MSLDRIFNKSVIETMQCGCECAENATTTSLSPKSRPEFETINKYQQHAFSVCILCICQIVCIKMVDATSNDGILD